MEGKATKVEGPGRSAARIPEGVSLLELVNRTIDRGVVLHGELMLSVADVDLVELRLDLRLAAVDPDEAGKSEADGEDDGGGERRNERRNDGRDAG